MNITNPTIEDSIETYKFGFSVTYDGDNHKVLYGTGCNRCNKYFESKIVKIYCDNCKYIN